MILAPKITYPCLEQANRVLAEVERVAKHFALPSCPSLLRLAPLLANPPYEAVLQKIAKDTLKWTA